MIQVIPLSLTESDYVQALQLDGVAYRLSLRWSGRINRWLWQLASGDGVTLTGWRKLVADVPLTANLVGGGLPAGDVWCVTSSGVDPGLLDLGDTAKLLYVTATSAT